jgi:predicted DNA-binding transcriptional regulator AlpA
MPQKEELIRKIQAQRRILDDLLVDVAALSEPAPAALAETPRQGPWTQGAEQDRLMRAKEVQEFLGIKPATFYDWIKKGAIPQGENFGGCTRTRRWRFSTICASLAGRKGAEK